MPERMETNLSEWEAQKLDLDPGRLSIVSSVTSARSNLPSSYKCDAFHSSNVQVILPVKRSKCSSHEFFYPASGQSISSLPSRLQGLNSFSVVRINRRSSISWTTILQWTNLPGVSPPWQVRRPEGRKFTILITTIASRRVTDTATMSFNPGKRFGWGRADTQRLCENKWLKGSQTVSWPLFLCQCPPSLTCLLPLPLASAVDVVPGRLFLQPPLKTPLKM